MTIFLALSALLNIALGYGLAIYLGHARSPFSSRQADDFAVDSFEMPVDMHASLPVEAPAAGLAKMPAAHSKTTSAVDELVAAMTPTEESAELETDVLAGIEEFRNQLAQMKAQPTGADTANGADTTAPQPARAAASV